MSVSANLLTWARERTGNQQQDLVSKFPKLPEWESGSAHPTLKQLKKYPAVVHVPLGYFFMRTPPKEQLPVSDFRTFDNEIVSHPSPDLLDTLYICQERQAWYNDFAHEMREPRLNFVGSADISMSCEDEAETVRNTIGFLIDKHRRCSTVTDALKLFIQCADQAGILVMVNGIVLINTHRKLSPKEFRGIALSDLFAPLIFINGSDSKSAQMFTLAHELAHLWLNVSGLSNTTSFPSNKLQEKEVWCNKVAAELLVPLGELRSLLLAQEDLSQTKLRLTKYFKVSTQVILRRLLDIDYLKRDVFDQEWTQASKHSWKNERKKRGGGGNFHRTTVSRVGDRFARAL